MKIECSVSDDFVDSDEVIQIEIELSEHQDDKFELILLGDTCRESQQGMIVEYASFEQNAVLFMPSPSIEEILNTFEGHSKKPSRIFLTKEHPMFDTIIKIVEAEQVLS